MRPKVWQVKHIPLPLILEACEAWQHRGGPRPFDAIREALPGAPDKVVFAAMMRQVDRGLLEYGTFPTSPWLTEEGRAYLTGGPVAAALVHQVRTSYLPQTLGRLIGRRETT